MNIKSVICGLALVASMGAAVPAFADTAIPILPNKATLSASDLSSVQDRCDQLLNDTTSQNIGNLTDNGVDVPDAHELAQATTRINLSALTLDTCVTAGFVKAG